MPRLPPLSPFLKGWRLDAWQKRVLRHIDRGRSAVVCAPTSSGKTVISTYTCVANERARGGVRVPGGRRASLDRASPLRRRSQHDTSQVLFVVPTEPLVWQVAAMFERLLQGTARVALATNQLAYRPSEDKSRVVVGTPLALESALVKIRGQVGDETTGKRWDYAQLDGGFEFNYAVFDEVHALDGEEGAARRPRRAPRGWFLGQASRGVMRHTAGAFREANAARTRRADAPQARRSSGWCGP